jgi:hypothetical protein
MKLKNTFFLIAMCSGLNFLALPIQAIDDADQPIDSDSKEETVSSSTSDDGGEDGAPGAGLIFGLQNEFLQNVGVDFSAVCDGFIKQWNEKLSKDLRIFLKSLNDYKEGKLHYEGVLLAAKPLFKDLHSFNSCDINAFQAKPYAWTFTIIVKALLKIRVPCRLLMGLLTDIRGDFNYDFERFYENAEEGLAYFNAFIHGIWPVTLAYFFESMESTTCSVADVEKAESLKDLLFNTAFISFLLFLNPDFGQWLQDFKDKNPTWLKDFTLGSIVKMLDLFKKTPAMLEKQAFGTFIHGYLSSFTDYLFVLNVADPSDYFEIFFADDYLLDQWLFKAALYQLDNAPFDEDSLSMAVFKLGGFIKDYKSVEKDTDAKKRKERPEGSGDEEPNPKKPKPNGKDEL